MITLTIYSRPGCHLCDDMKALVSRVTGGLREAGARAEPIAIADVDISGNPDLEARYGLEVPVLLVNGRKAAKYRIGEEELRKRLEAEVRG